MADWNTVDLDDIVTNGYNNNSRKSSSQGSGLSDNKENNEHTRGINQTSADTAGIDELVLARGGELNGESRTELSPTWLKGHPMLFPESTSKQATHTTGSGTAKAKSTTSPHVVPPVIVATPAEDITIPSDANISLFTYDQLAIFLRCLKIEDRIISHLHRKQVDGKRFAKLKDSELESLGINNPVVVFFRNKSSVKGKGKGPFML